MIKLYRKYKYIRGLKNILDIFDDQEIHIDAETWLNRNKYSIGYFDNDPKIRSLIAQILVKWRKKFPYEPQYIKAKKLYLDYFEIENHIPSFKDLKVGDYVVKFRSKSPVKGERYNEYYVNGSFETDIGRTYKLDKFRKKYQDFEFEVDDNYGEGLDEDNFTSFRYATEEEISKYKKDIEMYRALKEQIEKSFKHTGELQKMKNKIFKL